MRRSSLAFGLVLGAYLSISLHAQETVPAKAPDATPAKPTITIPTGTMIAVRTIDAIDSNNADLNHTYAASLSDPLMAGNMQLAPRNADAALRVTKVEKAGVLGGKASLTLKLVAIKVNGVMVPVETGTTVKQSESQANKAVTRSVIGGGLGAAVGAASGGGSGALIGAGAGVGAAVVTAALSGEHIQVARETRLTFSLTQPATVEAPAAAMNVRSGLSGPPEPPHATAVTPFVQSLEGWIVTLQRCEKNASLSVTCFMTIANQKADRDLTITPDTNIIDSDGNQQSPRVLQVGMTKSNGKSPVKITVVPEAPVKFFAEFGGVEPAIERLARLKVTLTWERINSSVEFRNVPLVAAAPVAAAPH